MPRRPGAPTHPVPSRGLRRVRGSPADRTVRLSASKGLHQGPTRPCRYTGGTISVDLRTRPCTPTTTHHAGTVSGRRSRRRCQVDRWAHRALLRTVAAWPALHPWRLGDDKESRRSLVWNAVPVSSAVPVDESVIDASQGLAVLTQTAPPPALSLGDVGADGEVLGGATLRASSSMTGALLSALASGLSRATADAVADAVRQPADVIDSCRR